MSGFQKTTNMNESLSNKQSNEAIAKPKLFGLVQSIAGALIGILVFLIVLFLMIWGAKSRLLTAAMLSPGFLALIIISTTDLGSNIHALGYMIILFSVSSIPPAIIGSLIVSKKKVKRTNGFILLGIYLVTSILAGIFVLVAASIFN